MWDRRYLEHPWSDEPDPLLVGLAVPLPAGAVLDLGCGPARNTVWLAVRGWQVTGVDTSAVGLAQSHQRAADTGAAIKTIRADLMEYVPPVARFDLVVIANIHQPEPARNRLFTRASEALRPGGHLFVVGHHLESLGRLGPGDPDRLYNEGWLLHAFPLLTVDRLERVDRPARSDELLVVDVVVWAVRTEDRS